MFRQRRPTRMCHTWFWAATTTIAPSDAIGVAQLPRFLWVLPALYAGGSWCG
ncbi:hypothetical protein GCM10009735_38210 [Actinomadura chokoriensis]